MSVVYKLDDDMVLAGEARLASAAISYLLAPATRFGGRWAKGHHDGLAATVRDSAAPP
jgi:hypothetical protein